MPRMAAKPFGEDLRVVVILVQPRRAVLECDEAGRREHADLAHASAKHLPDRPAALDELAAADDHRPDGRAKTFAEAELHGVEFLGHLRDVLLQVRRRVEDSRPIEMHLNAGIVRAVADVVRKAGWIDGSTGHVHGVLETNQGGLRTVVHLRSDRRRDRLPRQQPVLAVHDARKHAGERSECAHFVVVDMAVGLANHFLAVPRVRHDTGQIPHRSRWDEQRGFTPKYRGCTFLQAVHRRVFEEHVVSDFGFGHCAAHGWRRFGYGV